MTTSGLLKWGKSGENVETSTVETRIWQVCHRWWYGLWHRHRIELFSKIHVHSWTEWMNDCERCWTVLQKIQCKTLTNVLWFGVCLCLRHWKHLSSWARIFRQFTFHQKYWRRSHFKADVRDIWKVDIGTNRWDFLSVSNQLEKFSTETIISGQWWRSNQSLACKGLCIFRFCVMSWKGESEPNIKYCLGATVGMVQRFITIQNFGHNRRRTNGIRVEYFPRIHYIAARPRSPKVHEQSERPISIPRTNYLHVDVQWHHMGN